MDYERHKSMIQNFTWYLDRLKAYRFAKDWDRVKEIYQEMKQLDLDFQVQMEKRQGAAYIVKEMDIPEAVCRIIGADAVMLDIWPDLAMVACAGDEGWHQARTFAQMFVNARI